MGWRGRLLRRSGGCLMTPRVGLTKTHMSIRGAFTFLIVTSSCAAPPPDRPANAPAETTSAEDLQNTRAEIDRLIGQARASTLSQCALVALGDRPCGGPRTYLAYSLAETDSAQLAEFVDLYTRLDRERNVEVGLVSSCEVLARPTVVLEGGRCVTRPTG